MVLHAGRSDIPVIVVSKDTDVLILLVYACHMLKPANRWLMKMDNNGYVDIYILCYILVKILQGCYLTFIR